MSHALPQTLFWKGCGGGGVDNDIKDSRADSGLSPGRSAGAARTAWGSSRGRGWGRSLPGWSPSAAPDPKTARWPADSAPRHHRRTWRPDWAQWGWVSTGCEGCGEDSGGEGAAQSRTREPLEFSGDCGWWERFRERLPLLRRVFRKASSKQ